MVLIFGLPAFNEAGNLPSLLGKIGEVARQSGLSCRVVLVDDGSRDGTAEVARRCAGPVPLRVIEHRRNLGFPAALRDVLAEAAREAGADDVVVTMDADNTHEPTLAVQMARLLAKGGYDLVIASRYQPGGREVGLAWHRHLLSRGANLLLRLLFPMTPVRDYTSGFRAFRVSSLRRMFELYGDRLIESKTFSATAEVLLKLRLATQGQARAAEVPLVLRYDQKRGGSKMRVWSTAFDYLAMIERLRPWLVPLGLCALLAGVAAWANLIRS